ncbi:fiber protein [Deer mastadenovirus B]|uniref:Fiber protein n=1 Tax=Deer mastadenovirus B TaxID=2170000 RepID=A0A1Y0B6I6_9ADEN|nr:fiber protein [Deer mastadenovirus B]ART33380.1 fiber protein [Deer mastadenovirus B]
MKRAATQDLNLVYPYTTKRPHIMPPFYDRKGFFENQDATLAMNVEKPFKFDEDGSLTLGLGRGIHLNPEGLLETNDLASAVISPLASDSAGNVTLLFSEGLHLKNKRLAILPGPGLSFTLTNALRVNTGNGLTVADHNQLAVVTQYPLTATADGLSLLMGPSLHLGDGNRLMVQTGAGLQILNNAVTLKAGPGIYLNAQDQIAAALGDGLEIRANKTTIKTGPGLTLNNSALTVLPGKGLYIDGNTLAVHTGPGLRLDDITRTLTLQTGAGLTLTPEGLLQININVGQGLTYAQNTLNLDLGPGLYIAPDQNKLSLYPGEGIAIRDNRVTVPPGPGLRMVDHQLAVSPGDGLEIHDSLLRVRAGNGLALTSGELQARLGPGLTADSSGRTIANISRGLRMVNNAIQVFIGAGIRFGTDNSLSINCRSPLDASHGTLVVNLAGSGPISYNNGTFGLNIGPGLYVDRQRLQVNPGAGLRLQGNNLLADLHAPLGIIDNKIGLNLGPGLTADGSNLTLELGTGLQFSNRALAVKLGRGLRFDSSSQAVENSLTAGDGLTLTDTVIRPNLGDGLELRNNKIFVKLGANLRFENGAITAAALNPSPPTAPVNLTAEAPLRVSNSHLQLSLGEGLYVNNSALALRLGNGLTMDQQGLTLRVGSGLQMREGVLTVTPTGNANLPRLAAPLSLAENEISLTIGAGLELINSALQVKPGPGMRLNPSSKYLTLLLGPGITFGRTPSNNEDDLRLSLDAPMIINSRGQLTLLVGKGFQIHNAKLELNLGQGLKTNPATKQLYIPIGRGLEYVENQDEPYLAVKLGAGLEYDNQGRITTGPNLVIQTLWTGMSNTGNVTWHGYTAPGSAMFLSLTRFTTGLVMGTMSMQSNSQFGQYVNAGHGRLECFILLDNQGNLRAGSNLQGTWEVKDNPGASKSPFMPSSTLYPILTQNTGTLPGRNLIAMQPILGAGGFCTLLVTLNGRRSIDYAAGHALIFVWQDFNTISRQPFEHSTVTFSYWS